MRSIVLSNLTGSPVQTGPIHLPDESDETLLVNDRYTVRNSLLSAPKTLCEVEVHMPYFYMSPKRN